MRSLQSYEDSLKNPISERQLAGRKIALTGATGFIGSCVMLALLRSDVELTVLVRQSRQMRQIRAFGAHPVLVDFADSSSLEAALKNCEILINFAYDMRASAGPNIAVFDALLSAAQAVRIARIVQASSVAVYDGWPLAQELSEEAPCDAPPATAYVAAKREIEARLMAQGKMTAAILQPSIVYGPGSAIWTEAPLAILAKSQIVLPDPSGHCPAVFVEDVVQACLKAALCPDLRKERFLISGADNLTWSDLFEGYARVLGKGEIQLVAQDKLLREIGPPRTGAPRIPGIGARLGGAARQVLGHAMVEAAGELVRGLKTPRGPAWPSPSQLQLYCGCPKINLKAAQTRLGYQPSIKFEAGLQSIAATFR
ncbi:MAG: NAD-dependent epimerase/dehydratase family protein [Mangrovicoccus sp.]